MLDESGHQVRRNIFSWSSFENDSFELSNKGLRITLLARAVSSESIIEHDTPQDPDLGSEHSERLLVVLDCNYSNSYGNFLAMYLRRRPWVAYGLHRPSPTNRHDYVIYDLEARYTTVSVSEARDFTKVTLTIARKGVDWPSELFVKVNWASAKYRIKETLPIEAWEKESEDFWLVSALGTSGGLEGHLIIERLGFAPVLSHQLFFKINLKGEIGSARAPFLHVHLNTQRGEEISNQCEHHVFDIDGHATFAVHNETILLNSGEMAWILTVTDP